MNEQRKIRLITRGDDLGSFHSANAAILDAFHNGLLHNTSIMVPAPAFEDAVELVKNVTGLCLGLHITLTSEWQAPRWGPLSAPEKVPSLIGSDGTFFRSPHELSTHQLNAHEAIQEAQMQLDRARAKGLDIRYADEHMAVGWVRDINTKQRLAEHLQAWAEREGLIWHMSRQSMSLVDAEGLDSVEKLIQKIDMLDTGNYLLMTHPAYDTAEMRTLLHADYPQEEKDRGQEAGIRYNDYRMLCDPALARLLKERAIDSVRYDQI